MPSAEVLMAQIAARVRGGTYDAELDDLGIALQGLAEALKSRRRELGQQQVNRMKQGDQVKLSGLRSSSGLNGLVATVVEPLRTRAKVRIPPGDHRHAGNIVTVPGSCMTLVAYDDNWNE